MDTKPLLIIFPKQKTEIPTFSEPMSKNLFHFSSNQLQNPINNSLCFFLKFLILFYCFNYPNNKINIFCKNISIEDLNHDFFTQFSMSFPIIPANLNSVPTWHQSSYFCFNVITTEAVTWCCKDLFFDKFQAVTFSR